MRNLFFLVTRTNKEAEYIDAHILAMALDHASETAYKAVMKPKEGTILTVAKGMSTKALEVFEEKVNLINQKKSPIADKEIEEYLEKIEIMVFIESVDRL